MELGTIDFEILFGAEIGSLPAEVEWLINECDFSYRELSITESDSIILSILKTLDSDILPVSGKERKNQWEKGWSENLQNFVDNQFDIAELSPKYYRPNNILRLDGRYIKSNSTTFEFDFFRMFRLWVCHKYIGDVDAIFEFGCGSGCNLPVLVDLFPKKELHGLDWAQSSVDIVNKMRSEYGWKMTGHLFDLFTPDYSLEVDCNSVFLTFGALEQLGSNYKAFVDFILDKQPALCINVEPLYELYSPDKLLDYLAMRYHKKRGYLDNFLLYLESLEEQGKVQFIDINRMYFGGLYQDGWSRVVWCPKRDKND